MCGGSTAGEFWAEICSNQEISSKIYLMKIKIPAGSIRAKAGQFLHLRCGEGTEWVLRRPLSIHDVAGENEIVLLYQVVGKGTAWLGAQEPGAKINILGPLGRGFSSLKAGSRALLVAGGLGVAPLFFLARDLLQARVDFKFLLGARTSSLLLRLEALRQLGVKVEVATDDGSAGFGGLVTRLLEEELKKAERLDMVFACGPRPMLATCAGLLASYDIPGEVSLEEHMACGLGACRGCAVPVHSPGGTVTYENVCSRGPVFAAREVVWENVRARG